MLDIKMSKEADALLSVLYAVYKSRRKEGMSKSSAKEFDPDFFQNVEPSLLTVSFILFTSFACYAL